MVHKFFPSEMSFYNNNFFISIKKKIEIINSGLRLFYGNLVILLTNFPIILIKIKKNTLKMSRLYKKRRDKKEIDRGKKENKYINIY